MKSPISQIKLRDRERTTGDGAEYEKTKHIKDQLDTNTMDDVPTNTYAELTEEVAILRLTVCICLREISTVSVEIIAIFVTVRIHIII